MTSFRFTLVKETTGKSLACRKIEAGKLSNRYRFDLRYWSRKSGSEEASVTTRERASVSPNQAPIGEREAGTEVASVQEVDRHLASSVLWPKI
ncbi:hypothetical protein JCGZ_06013 [Jatropha curcas]|uniref:Uncharacterized protein n=1 Tax=Jatropha curcas TaxID=180498 RepID=A0A067KNQ8_JATCU|nr:hypothetical protein JCGZ_06013 [Jatropha curcas]